METKRIDAASKVAHRAQEALLLVVAVIAVLVRVITGRRLMA